MKSVLIVLAIVFTSPIFAEPIGVIATTMGDVIWQRGVERLRLQRGESVERNDTVVTGKKARVVLRMNEGSVITLGGDTGMAFNEWNFREGGDDNSARLQLMEGAFRFVTGLITQQSDPKLVVQTPSATIGVRGTDFWGGYLDADNLDVILLSGEHKLAIINDYGLVYITEPGLGVTVAPGKKPAQPKKWGEAKLQRAVATIALPPDS